MSTPYDAMLDARGVLPAAIQRLVVADALAEHDLERLGRLVSRPDLDPATEGRLLFASEPLVSAVWVRLKWLFSARVRPEIAERMLDDEDPQVRRAVAACAGLSQAAYLELGCDASLAMLNVLAGNPSVTEATLGALLTKLATGEPAELRAWLELSATGRVALERCTAVHEPVIEMLLDHGEADPLVGLLVRLEGITAAQYRRLLAAVASRPHAFVLDYLEWPAILASPHADEDAWALVERFLPDSGRPGVANARERDDLAVVRARDFVPVLELALRRGDARERLLLEVHRAGPGELPSKYTLLAAIGVKDEHSPLVALAARLDLTPEAAAFVASAPPRLTPHLVHRLLRGDGLLETDATLALRCGGDTVAALLQRRGTPGEDALLAVMSELGSGSAGDQSEALCELVARGRLLDLPATRLPTLLECSAHAVLEAIAAHLGEDLGAYETFEALRVEFGGSIGELLEVARRLGADELVSHA